MRLIWEKYFLPCPSRLWGNFPWTLKSSLIIKGKKTVNEGFHFAFWDAFADNILPSSHPVFSLTLSSPSNKEAACSYGNKCAYFIFITGLRKIKHSNPKIAIQLKWSYVKEFFYWNETFAVHRIRFLPIFCTFGGPSWRYLIKRFLDLARLECLIHVWLILGSIFSEKCLFSVKITPPFKGDFQWFYEFTKP